MAKDVCLMIIARLLFGLHQWAIIAILAHNSLTSEIGVLGYSLAVIVPIAGLFSLGVRQGIATDVKNKYSLKDYLTVRLLFALIFLLIIFCIASTITNDPKISESLVVLSFAKSVELMSEMAYGVFQRQHATKHISFSLIFRSIFGLFGFTLGFHIGELTTALLLWSLAWFCVYIFYDYPTMTRLEKIDYRAIKINNQIIQILLLQSPMAFGSLFGNLSNSFPRIILQSEVSLETLGIFTAIFTLYQPINTIFIAAIQLIITPLAKATQYHDYRKALKLISISSAVTITCLLFMWLFILLFSANILTIAYGETYTEYSSLLIQIGAGWTAAFLSVVFRETITAMRLFSVGFLIDLAKFAMISSCCYFFLKLGTETSLSNVANGYLTGQWLTLAITIITLVCAIYFASKKGSQI